ncbi:MAG: protein kinase [Pirellulaceae bacterium]|nr:protein kinase [Pirellulaceae bacterium]
MTSSDNSGSIQPDDSSFTDGLLDSDSTQLSPQTSPETTPGGSVGSSHPKRVNVHPGGGRSDKGAPTARPTTPGAHHPSVPDAPEYRVGDIVENRYEIQGRLGRGGFGAVYSALDRSLNRVVAIKQSTGLRSFVAGRVRNEARAVASLNHPNIVQIHDLVQVNDVEILIVMERLNGISLAKRLKQSRLTLAESVKIGIAVTDALMHAHEQQLVHSDLKPANLFVCDNGAIKLLDFGLAVAYFPDQSTELIGGTPGYMSPEQIRGESHLIDGRTDIWAFGIVLFEMVTGTRPFVGKNGRRINLRTLSSAVPPPRQLNSEIDNELQRIVLKCLQPLISSRYSSTAQLREDLVQWLAQHDESALSVDSGGVLTRSGVTSSVPSSARLAKRGLQPFTESDASTYLSLIPGPRDRDGIPDSIRFWKRWAESDDPQTDFPVGVLYGPSGSGKSSYVRAGLFKQLSAEVCRVYIECRPGNLGARLSRIIENRLREPESGSSLHDLLCRLRSGDPRRHGFEKLLIVLDQFECWAHNASLEERIEFAEALRQCDGVQIRALVVTRDDYWTAAKELLHWLEIPMQEDRNVASVDLLDPAHAQQILESIGRESGSLPDDGEPLSDEQQQFLSQAVSELTVDGSVICVHLVMFGQMVRLQEWTPRGLHDSGGVVGACALFFQELFERSGTHSPEYRRVGPAVPHLLSKLVPPVESSVADVVASKSELSQIVTDAGYAHLFDDCLRVLSEDLRIISVVGSDSPSPDPVSDPSQVDPPDEQYRLAHDFLVDPINQCLSRMNSRTWRGRTKSRLVELSNVWWRRKTNIHLPGFIEYLSLLPGALLQKHGKVESQYLRAATRLHAGRISAVLLSFFAFVMMSIVAWTQWRSAQDANRRELTANIDMLLNGDAAELPTRIDVLRSFGNDAIQDMTAWSESVDPNLKLRSQLFLQSVDPQSFQSVASMLNVASPEFFESILSIGNRTPDAITSLRSIVAAPSSIQSDRATILLAYLGDDSALRTRMAGSDDAGVDQALVGVATTWRGKPELWADLLHTSSDPQVRYHAAVILGSYRPAELIRSSIQLDLAKLINDTDAVVHSSGRYLANHLGQDAFAIALTPPANADWRVGPDNTPMVRLGPADFTFTPRKNPAVKSAAREVAIKVERPFWMATIPVSQRLYRQFAESDVASPEGFDPEISLERFEAPDYLLSDDNQPQVGMNLAQAYQFCNWLSRRDGLKPCYRPREVEEIVRDRTTHTIQPIPWTFDDQADGYRVPTVNEFNLAAHCRYTQGPLSQLAIQIAKQTGTFDPEYRLAHQLFTLIPTRYGGFLYDPQLSCWVCGDEHMVSQTIHEHFVRGGMMIQPPWPGTAIYLAQNGTATPLAAD